MIIDNNLMHALPWASENIAGWTAQEKFDGCRAYWDGNQLWSRQGKTIQPTSDWLYNLPNYPLDCEIYAGPGSSRKCADFIKHGYKSKHYKSTMLIAFDAPTMPSNYLNRVIYIPDFFRPRGLWDIWHFETTEEYIALRDKVQSRGGEGLIVRHPEHIYHPGRSNLMLKIK